MDTSSKKFSIAFVISLLLHAIVVLSGDGGYNSEKKEDIVNDMKPLKINFGDKGIQMVSVGNITKNKHSHTQESQYSYKSDHDDKKRLRDKFVDKSMDKLWDKGEYPTNIGGRYKGLATADLKYEQLLSLWLDKHRNYPKKAKEDGIKGEGRVFLKISRDGKVLLSKVIKTTGYEVLDQALIDMVRDASPVIPMQDWYYPGFKTRSYMISFRF